MVRVAASPLNLVEARTGRRLRHASRMEDINCGHPSTRGTSSHSALLVSMISLLAVDTSAVPSRCASRVIRRMIRMRTLNARRHGPDLLRKNASCGAQNAAHACRVRRAARSLPARRRPEPG